MTLFRFRTGAPRIAGAATRPDAAGFGPGRLPGRRSEA